MIEPATATIAGLPRWLIFCLLTISLWGAWGAVSKVASDGVDANTNQILFTIGLTPLIVIVRLSPRLEVGKGQRSGIAWSFVTGVLAAIGNIAFFQALVVGGKASIVVPGTALFPVVTIVLAVTFLRERLSRLQIVGLILAMVAVYLLSNE
ncbi:MAG: EamA family transporter [Acidobacteriota bacterium]